jgi:MFS family permease
MKDRGHQASSAGAVSSKPGRHLVPRDIRLMSLAFLLVFLGYDGVQQYAITYFNGLNLSRIGFVSLILVYTSFSIGSPFAASVVARFGARQAMLVSPPLFSLFLLSLITKFAPIIWGASIATGLAGIIFWNAQNTYLVRAAYDDALGTSAGYFAAFKATGSGVGVVVVGFAVVQISYVATFLAAALLPLLACIFVARMTDIRAPQRSRRLATLSALHSKTVWRVSAIWFSMSFVFGLALSAIPLIIRGTLGLAYVGLLSSCFYVVPIVASYTVGNQSDIKGRRALLYVACASGAAGLFALNFPGAWGAVVAGVILVAISNSTVGPVATALAGDVATDTNLDAVVALFRMVQGAGIVAGLLLAGVFAGGAALRIALVGLIICFAISLPVFRDDIPEIRRRVAGEIG